MTLSPHWLFLLLSPFAVMLRLFPTMLLKTQTSVGCGPLFPPDSGQKFLLVYFFCFKIFIYLFLAVLGLHPCVGLSLVTVSRATL